MKNNILSIASAGIGSLIGFLFGEIDGLFYTMVAFTALDYVTGVIVAVIQKNLSSEIGVKGIFRKLLYFIVIAVANIIDAQIINSGSVLRTAVLFMFIANEGISLLENVAGMGVPVPEKMVEVLKQLKHKDKKESGETKDED